MVLKKSNSDLNTGTTQRLINKGAFLNEDHYIGHPGTVSVFLTGHEDNSTESLTIFQDGLKTIYDYLDLQGPDLSLFYDRDGFTRLQHVFNQFQYTKNETQDSLSLPEKVRKMIDAKVLESEMQAVAVEFNIYKRCPQKPTNQKKLIFSWNSTGKKDKLMNTKEERKRRRKKNKSNTHHRGIQRRHRVSLDEDHFSDEEDTQISIPLRKITIEIEETYAIDARLVNKPFFIRKKKFEFEKGAKSCYKLKGFVNGLRSDFKGYNFSSLKEDETEALMEAAEEDEAFLYEDFNTVDEDEDFAEYSVLKRCICLGNYITMRSKAKRQNKFHDISQTKSAPINSASSETVLRHPKGSCVFITTTTEENDSDVDMDSMDSGFEGNSSFKSDANSIDDQVQERQTVDNVIDCENFEFELNANIHDFISKFIKIQLLLPPEIVDKIHSFSAAGARYAEDDCYISFGNCCPPTFLLRLNSNDGIADKNSFYLTGKAMEVNDNHFRKWQVQVGKMNTCESEIEIAGRIMSTLKDTKDTEITLKDLICIFKESLEYHLTIAGGLVTASCLTSHFSASQNRESPWCTLAHFMPMSAQTISLEEAFNLLGSKSDRQASESVCSFQLSIISSASSSSAVCDICFLPCDFSKDADSEALALQPCGHVYCLSCWSSYVYVNLCTADSIQCMDSDCKQELNETVLRGLAPGHMINKWLQRLEDKTIEKNPLSKWCPNTHCDMVAVLPEVSTTVNQFGSLVLCDCQHHWCFNCQTEPHWPASCDQAASFRKLLAKTGNNLEIPAARVDYTIQLKRCPKCHYPIEKNEGCPSMVCRMCWFNFCWNCLRAVDHSVYSCKARTDNFDTFNLQNNLVHELPLKFFPDFLEMNRKRKNMKSKRISSWFKKLQLYNSKLLNMPLKISLEIGTKEDAKSRVINIAESVVEFLLQVYTFLESYYELLSFVNMIKNKSRQTINLILHHFVQPAGTLRFITCRLEDQIICKTVAGVLNYAPTADVLIKCGKKHMKSMARDLHTLQHLTKCVDVSRVGDLDPMKCLRYK